MELGQHAERPLLPQGVLGTRREVVEHFLLGGLQQGTLAAYTRALESFRIECERQQVVFGELSEEEQDWIAAEYLLELRDQEPLQRQRGAVLIAALTKVCPTRRYKISRKVLDAWSRELPVKQAPACPDVLLYAIVVLLQAWG